jgi:uncharacterized membrane protein
MIKALIVVSMAMFFAALSDVYFRKGMKVVGALEAFKTIVFIRYIVKAISNGYVFLGIVFASLTFFLWLIALSWSDVSWALPMSSVQYIFVTFIAIVMLKEKVNRERWIGILLIIIGIAFLMESWQ